MTRKVLTLEQFRNVRVGYCLQRERDDNEMMDTIVTQMKYERGVTEQLKADDWWRWVQEIGNIRNAAEEFVLREIVYG
jgi:hypothetical protein